MLKDRVMNLFSNYDAPIRSVIAEVLSLEQENISMERPRVKDEIDALITRVANTVLEQGEPKRAEGSASEEPNK